MRKSCSSTIAALGFIKGRMYDYNNGRFLSVDPFIQAPTSTQSLNPYTYIFNNPLSGTDPTGYKSLGDTGAHAGVVAGVSLGVISKENANQVSSALEKIGDSSLVGAVDTANLVTALATGGIAAVSEEVGRKVINRKSSKNRRNNNSQGSRTETRNGNNNNNQGSKTEASNSVSEVESQDTITVYRGVDKNSPAFEDAKNGLAKPRGGENGHTDANAHSAGRTESSNFTSFSTDKEVAKDFATNDAGEGVVLTKKVRTSEVTVPTKPFDPREKEVLLKGEVKADKVESQTERVDTLGYDEYLD